MKAEQIDNPTGQTYGTFESAYTHFNETLFSGRLPSCLITVQRRKRAYGYFSGGRFSKVGIPTEVTDEIAMNPLYFNGRSIRQTLSTLAHEMAHLWQHHFGKPSRGRYHNKQWAAKMREIGLIPSNTGEPGGKQTGQSMTHYIKDGGQFDLACVAWLAQNPGTLYHDRASINLAGTGIEVSKTKVAASKIKYTCPGCGANAWGKPGLSLMCGKCREIMTTEGIEVRMD